MTRRLLLAGTLGPRIPIAQQLSLKLIAPATRVWACKQAPALNARARTAILRTRRIDDQMILPFYSFRCLFGVGDSLRNGEDSCYGQRCITRQSTSQRQRNDFS